MKRKKKAILVMLVVTMLFTLSACGKCEHNWIDATCEEDEYCSLCGEMGDLAIGHRWVEATCEESEYCSVCNKTNGEPLGHDWVDATCTEMEYCEVCGEKGEKAKGHSYDKGHCKDCYLKDPDYVDLSTFGFTNMYGMDVWIEVDGYSFEQGYATLDARLGPSLKFFYVDSGYYESYFIEFEQLVLGKADKEDCDLFAGNTVFTVSSNSIINTERGIWTIFDRKVYTAEEMLVLKTKFNGTEHWYVPIDLLDLTETTRDDEYTYFYFK